MPGYNQGGKFDDIVNQVLINLTQKESTSPNCNNEVLPQSLTKKKRNLNSSLTRRKKTVARSETKRKSIFKIWKKDNVNNGKPTAILV
jgi:hypothetical protein